MSQETADAAATDAPATSEQTDTDPSPTETVEFWKAKAREQEKRAKANASAADELAAYRQTQMTEAEKASARVAELEAEARSARADALRFKVASKYGVSDDDAELFLTGEDEETLTRQAKRLAERAEAADKPRAPRPDPNQGRTSTGPRTNSDLFAAAIDGVL